MTTKVNHERALMAFFARNGVPFTDTGHGILINVAGTGDMLLGYDDWHLTELLDAANDPNHPKHDRWLPAYVRVNGMK